MRNSTYLLECVCVLDGGLLLQNGEEGAVDCGSCGADWFFFVVVLCVWVYGKTSIDKLFCIGMVHAMTPSLIRWSKDHKWFILAFTVACVSVLWPVWYPRYIPLVDWPHHVGLLSFFKHQYDPAWGFQIYAHQQRIYTYALFYDLGRFFALFLSAEQAGRAVLSVYMVATPLAGMWMLRCFRLSPWLSLLIFPVLYNWCFYMGFLPFVVCFPLFFIGVGLIRLMGDGIRGWWMLWFVLVTLLLVYSHTFAYLMFGAMSLPLLFLYYMGNWRRIALVTLGWVPSIAYFVFWAFVVFGTPPFHYLQHSMTTSHGGGLSSVLRAEYLPWSQRFVGLRDFFNNVFVSNADVKIFFFWLFLFVLLAGFLRYLSFQSETSAEQPKEDDVPVEELAISLDAEDERWKRVSVVGLHFLMYFAFPMSLVGVWAVCPRFLAVFALFFVLMLPRFRVADHVGAVLFLPAVALCVWVGVLNTNQFVAFGKEVAGLKEVIRHIPRGKRTYGLMYDMNSGVMSIPALVHLPGYVMIERGGNVGFSHFVYKSMPARIHRIALSPFPGLRGEWEPNRWRHAIYGSFYDYLLVRGSSVDFKKAKFPKGSVRLVKRVGRWSLYHHAAAKNVWPLYAFREHVEKALVSQSIKGKTTQCPLQKGPVFRCSHARWAKVEPAAPVMDGIEVPCIWAHPVPHGTVSLAFSGLPRKGRELRGIFGLADTAKDKDYGHAVRFSISVNGKQVFSSDTSRTHAYLPYRVVLPDDARRVTFHVTGKDVGRRHFCFRSTLFQQRIPKRAKTD